jgi:hypothetical protein
MPIILATWEVEINPEDHCLRSPQEKCLQDPISTYKVDMLSLACDPSYLGDLDKRTAIHTSPKHKLCSSIWKISKVKQLTGGIAQVIRRASS